MQNWVITRADDGIATLLFDRAGATANTLSQQVLAELNEALDIFDRDPPKGVIVRSGKASSFIAGADITEFGKLSNPDAAMALVKRGWDTFMRVADVSYPTLALIKGFCLGGGLELSLACRYRVVIDEPGTRLGLPEVMLGIVPGWGGIHRLPRMVGAPAALDMLLTGKTIDARRAKKLGVADECVPVRIMENTARGVLVKLPPPRTLPFPLSLTLNPWARRIITSQAAKLFAERLKDPRRARDANDRLIPDVAGDGVARADVIIEAIFENLEAKRRLFAALEKKAKPEAILATNTSSIPLEDIAQPLADPSRLVGLHFFNPVSRMMLVEVVAGQKTRHDLVVRGAAFVRQIDKLPLPVKSAPGFLVYRLLAPYLMTAMRCVDEGIAPETVDEAALAFGMPMGPIELADTVGLDICMAVGKMLDPAAAPPPKLKSLIDAGKLGRKTGQGFYLWSYGKAAKQPAGTVPAGLP